MGPAPSGKATSWWFGEGQRLEAVPRQITKSTEDEDGPGVCARASCDRSSGRSMPLPRCGARAHIPCRQPTDDRTRARATAARSSCARALERRPTGERAAPDLRRVWCRAWRHVWRRAKAPRVAPRVAPSITGERAAPDLCRAWRRAWRHAWRRAKAWRQAQERRAWAARERSSGARWAWRQV